jgi:hypothetical protein
MTTTLFLFTVSVFYNATSPIAISQFLWETAMPVPCGLKVYFKSIAVRSYKNCLENYLLIRPDVFGTKGKGFCKRCHIDVFLAELYRVSPPKKYPLYRVSQKKLTPLLFIWISNVSVFFDSPCRNYPIVVKHRISCAW